MSQVWSPVSVVAPDGTRHEPVKVTVTAGMLTVTNCGGMLLAGDTGAGMAQGGRRHRTVTAASGVWRIDDICGCSSAKRELLRSWRGCTG